MTFQKRKEDTKRKGDKRRNRGGEGGKAIKEIRTEKEVWKYINRERKKKKSVNEEITI
jgi:hypothetical protein